MDNLREKLKIESQKEDKDLFSGLPDEILNMVIVPKHYFKNGFSPIELMDTVFTEELLLGRMISDMIKYITRYKDKENELQDISKVLFSNSYIINYIKSNYREDVDMPIKLYSNMRASGSIRDIFDYYIELNIVNKGNEYEKGLFKDIVNNIYKILMSGTYREVKEIAIDNNSKIKDLMLYLIEESNVK